MENIWGKLKHFSPQENWGDPNKMNGFLLLLLDKIREEFDCSMIIHYGFESDGHSSFSQHYLGNAVDFHFKTTLTIEEQYEKLEEFLKEYQLDNFVGLGVYPNWNNPGFHLDVRGKRARWGAWYDSEGKQQYGSIQQVLGG